MDSKIWGDHKALTVWIFCLFRAAREPRGCRGEDLEIGQLLVGTQEAADACCMSRSSFRRCLGRLVVFEMIRSKATTKGTMLTVCNYTTYQEQNTDGDHQPTTNRPPTDHQPATKKNKELRIKKEETPLPPFPETLQSDAFAVVWARWVKHRKEIRKPLTPTCLDQQLKKLADWGEPRAIAALEHTIGSGWQGIREPDANGQPKPTGPRVSTAEDEAGWNPHDGGPACR